MALLESARPTSKNTRHCCGVKFHEGGNAVTGAAGGVTEAGTAMVSVTLGSIDLVSRTEGVRELKTGLAEIVWASAMG